MADVCHVAHWVYSFSTGGLENVVVQLIDGLPADRFRHTVVAISTADPMYVSRIERSDVEVIELHKPPGQSLRMFPRSYRLLRRLRPDVVHSCNLAGLEFQAVAWAARVRRRIHAEHGWDTGDPDGRNARYRWLRRSLKRFVHEFVAVSPQLYDYLARAVGVAERHLHLIPNGVDTTRFRPARPGELPPRDFPFRRPDHWIVGTVGRLEPIKNPMLLVEAFIRLVKSSPDRGDRLRLALVGDGSLKAALRARLDAAGLADRVWLPGSRSDIPDILRALDCFVLPSRAEGTSCTLQEAMATGLPSIATAVEGNTALLENGRLGRLVRVDDAEALADALSEELAGLGKSRPEHARHVVGQRYAASSVIARYGALFLGD